VRWNWLILIGIVVVGVFLVYMMTFTVRFTEKAVVTTFGQADETDVITKEGLHWMIPLVQRETVYDTRSRLLEARLEQQQTRDNRQVIVESFMAWRVADPLVFYQRFRGSSGSDAAQHYRQAEDTLRSLLRSAMSETSKYQLSELLSAQSGTSKLTQLENDILSRLTSEREAGGANVSEYGIEVVLVGINRFQLPQDTTREVFERMRKTRERLAAEAESAGLASANAIKSQATQAASRIRNFAEVRATQIRSEGEREAAEFWRALQEEPELAVFLSAAKLLTDGFGRRPTLILPTSMAGIAIFADKAMEQARRGEIPEILPSDFAKTPAGGSR